MTGIANNPSNISDLAGSQPGTHARRRAPQPSAADRLTRFRNDVLAGLAQRPRTIPCKYLYDDRGSELFEEICELPEYYPTRSEVALLRSHRVEIAEALGRNVTLIEPGAGSGIKTRLLISALDRPLGVIPIEISPAALSQSAMELKRRFPDLTVEPIRGDFTDDIEIPQLAEDERRVIYFPGSTIGNFTPDERLALLRRFRAMAGDDGAALIGIDLKKDPSMLVAAYDDARGVTAAFNLNLLRRINRELGADFDLRRFAHRAVWNSEKSRIEMWIVSLEEQRITMGGNSWAFAEGEGIHTENSHKFTISSFSREASAAGFDSRAWWTDPAGRFAVLLLESAPVVGVD